MSFELVIKIPRHPWIPLTTLFVSALIISLILINMDFIFPWLIILLFIVLIVFSELTTEINLVSKSKIQFLKSNRFIYIVWFCCILGPFLSQKNQLTVIDWSSINPMAVFGAVCSILQCCFFLGFGFLKVFQKCDGLRRLEFSLLSIHLSLLLTGGIGFCAYMLGSFENLAIPILLAISIILFFTSLLNEIKTKQIQTEFIISSKFIITSIAISLFVGAAFFLVNYPLKLVPTIDQWYHFGAALRTQKDMLFDQYPAYYWNDLFNALVLSLSPLPPTNTYLLILPLGFIGIPSFYIMARKLVGANNAYFPMIIYTLFSGFAGILSLLYQLTLGYDVYTASLLGAAQTGDGIYGSLSFPLFYFPKSIGMSSIFVSIFLIFKLDPKKNKRYNVLILTSMITLSYLWHIAEALFLILIIPFVLVFILKEKEEQDLLLVSLFLSILIIALIDSLTPFAVYNLSITKLGSVLISLAILGSCLISMIIVALSRRKKIFDVQNQNHLQFIIKIVSAFLLIVSIVELLVWFLMIGNLRISFFEGVVPEFLYPGKLGLSLFIALIGIFKSNNTLRNRKHAIILILAILALIIGRVSSIVYLNFSVFIFWETRIIDFLWPWIAILAGLALTRLSRIIKIIPISGKSLLKQQIMIIIVVLILFIGLLTKPYEVEIRSQPNWYLTAEEVNEVSNLSYLSNNYAIVAGDIHIHSIRDFTTAKTLDIYSDYLLDAGDAIEALTVMHYNAYSTLNNAFPGYYASIDRYTSTLNRYEKSYFLKNLVEYIPIIMNESVDIYRIPFMAPPSRFPSVLVCTPQKIDDLISFNMLIEMLAVTNTSYAVIQANSIPLTSNVTTILNLRDEFIPELEDWIELGGKYIEVNYIPPDYQQQIIYSFDRIGNETSSLALNGVIPSIPFNTSGARTLFWYKQDDIELCPILSSSKRGEGEIMNLNLGPLFGSINLFRNRDLGRNLWGVLGVLWNYLGLDQSLMLSSFGKGLAVVKNEISLSGNITIQTTSLSPRGNYVVEIKPGFMNSTINGVLTDFCVIGDVIYEIRANNMTIISSEFSSVTCKDSQNQILSISLRNNGEAFINLYIDDTSYAIRLGENDTSLKLEMSTNGMNSTLMAVNPIVTCEGNSRFSYVYASWPFGVYFPGASANISGITQFTILAANTNIQISNFDVKGVYTIARNEAPYEIARVYEIALGNPLIIPLLVTTLVIMTVALTPQRTLISGLKSIKRAFKWMYQKISKMKRDEKEIEREKTME